MSSPSAPFKTPSIFRSRVLRRSGNWGRFCLLAAPLHILLATAGAQAESRHAKVHTVRVEDPYDHAVALRQQLDDVPAAQRTREQYEPVLDAFRAIYHENPGGSKAPASVAAVADLLAEKGKVFKELKLSKAAIGQYEFLRLQYPGSPQVVNALLQEGEVCSQDLKDKGCAEEKFKAVIAADPASSYAEQAALELKALHPVAVPGTVDNHPLTRSVASRPVPQTPAYQAPPQAAPASDQAAATGSEPQSTATSISAPHASGPVRIVTITGMRHWSNPTSTRIAIDLGGKVEYEAARVPNPDRIFFDLHGARLAPALNGHSIEVVDDGYLKRIRAAQFHPDVTRVVLDVTDVSQYSAFLLPNPWRLIIDIHSDKDASKQAIAKNKATANDTLSNGVPVATVSPAPAGPATIGPAPSSLQGKAKSSGNPAAETAISEVARLGNEPAKVPATEGPTSGPVSARIAAPDGDSSASSSSGADSATPPREFIIQEPQEGKELRGWRDFYYCQRRRAGPASCCRPEF